MCLHGKHPIFCHSNRKNQNQNPQTLNSARVEIACKFSVFLSVIHLSSPLPDSFTTQINILLCHRKSSGSGEASRLRGFSVPPTGLTWPAWVKGRSPCRELLCPWGEEGASMDMTHRGLSSLQRQFDCSTILPAEESHEELVALAAHPSPKPSVYLLDFPVLPGDTA